jgi:hypothetical protein
MPLRTVLVLIVTLMLTTASALRAAERALDTAKIEQLTGAKGKMNEKERVFKVSMARDDLKVESGGVKITPPMGLTCWAAFTPMGDHAMVMGDQVMTEDQVNPVMSVALDNGLEVTALHNHFSADQPRIMFMHIGGMGDPEKLAAAVGKVFAKIKETSGGKGEKLHASIDPAASTLDPKKIEDVIGQKGESARGV